MATPDISVTIEIGLCFPVILSHPKIIQLRIKRAAKKLSKLLPTVASGDEDIVYSTPYLIKNSGAIFPKLLQ